MTEIRVQQLNKFKKPELVKMVGELESQVEPKANKVSWLLIGVAAIAALSTVAFSMVLNVRAFTDSIDDGLAYCAGVAIPLWVLALTFIANATHAYKCKVGKWNLPLLTIGSYALAAFALIVSLPHLVTGYEAWGLTKIESISLSIVTDCTQVVCKAAIIACLRRR